MATQPKWVIPQLEGTIYRWSWGEVTFEVDAARGARITAFRIGTENILTGPEVNGLNYGSTFWTSPQSQWGWPPPVELDSEPYQTEVAEEVVSMTSRPDQALGLAVTKRFSVDADEESVAIEYLVENHASESRTIAPWEISRHPIGGLTFFPAGAGAAPWSTLAVQEANGALWFAYDPAPITDHQKLFAHASEGWIAHLDIARQMLLLKTFAEIAPGDQAPGEAQIELYADPGHTYVEVEQQGAYRPIAPGAKISWTVTWRLRRLPTAIAARVGNKDLLAVARALTSR